MLECGRERETNWRYDINTMQCKKFLLHNEQLEWMKTKITTKYLCFFLKILSESQFFLSRSVTTNDRLSKIQRSPRGLGTSDSNYTSNVKITSEINGINEKMVPFGHLPTTKEVLNDQHVNEIIQL